MIPLAITSPLPLKPLSLKPSLNPISTARSFNQLKQSRRRLRNGECRAEFSADAPVAVAIGACILSSLVFPVNYSPDDDDDDEIESLIDSTDKRFAVMGIISFIPYFNWMSWVFAWLDTGNQRYAVYAIVYLAPYLRSNLSISPEESWLPIASILLCIAHIQLEVSIKNGDLQGFQIFSKATRSLSSMTQKKKNEISQQEDRRKDIQDLPSAQEDYRNEIRDWKAPHEDREILNEDEETNGWGKH